MANKLPENRLLVQRKCTKEFTFEDGWNFTLNAYYDTLPLDKYFTAVDFSQSNWLIIPNEIMTEHF